MSHMTMQLRLPPEIRPLADKGSLTFEYGAFAGRDYGFELRVCPNPCCHCNDVELRCVPTKPSEDAVPSEPFCLMMNIVKHKIILPRQEERNGARELGKALVQEIAPFHWQLLTDRFMAVKAQISDQDDITGFSPDSFPREVLMNSGDMVGYHEILPYAGRLEVASEGRLWLIDEQYCLRYPCSCQASALTFIRVDEPSTSRRRQPFTIMVRYNYATGVFNTESETSPLPPEHRILSEGGLHIKNKPLPNP